MKKLLIILFSFLPFFCFAQNYHINKVNYFITGSNFLPLGKTNVYALEQKVPVDTNKIFEDKEDFTQYLNEYEIRLNNTRAFESINISFEENTNQTDAFLQEITLNVTLKDSFHLIALPHVLSYNSNDGWKPKLKAKDTNFLGSLNTMSSDVYGIIPLFSDNATFELGAEFDFDLPFKLYCFDCEWINDYLFSYNFNNSVSEWEAQTGILIKYPLKKSSLNLSLNQYSYRNYDYEEYDDLTYFTEQAQFSVPIKIGNSNYFGTIYYTPVANINYNWDYNDINPDNTDLSAVTTKFGQTLSSSNINWNGNYRKGISFSVETDYLVNISKTNYVPLLEFTAQYYNFLPLNDSSWFNKIGFTASFDCFSYINSKTSKIYSGKSIGSQLRGIRNDQYYSNDSNCSNLKALYTSSAIVLNLDFPFSIFTTSFTNKIMKIFNCEVQVSPFLDLALCNNRATGKTFDFKDGFYAGGFEVLVYPKKWSSFTIRGSLGLDLGRYLFGNFINNSWRRDVQKYEVSIGIGLFY